MTKRCNYVLASWSGLRECMPPNGHLYLKDHIDKLNSLKNNLSQVTIGHPHNINESRFYKRYVESLSALDNGVPIVVEDMDNIGRSYGQYNFIFEKYRDKFDYWIFMEDDYVPYMDYFDVELIKMFEDTKDHYKNNGGFLCQCAKKYLGYLYHAAVSNGISDMQSLNKVWDKFRCLPHDKIGYRNGQVTFSRSFLDVGLWLKDMTHKYRVPYYHIRNGIEEHNPKAKDYIIIPIQMHDIQYDIRNKPKAKEEKEIMFL